MTNDRARQVVSVLLWLGASWKASIAQAEPAPPPAYQFVARQAGVPAPVLYAVALQESGTPFSSFHRGRLVPWPWTLDVAGRAERFATKAEACAGLHRAMAGTALRQIDVGLSQINLGFHAHRYGQPCDLLDPYRNLAVAAEILREQHVLGEDWMVAVGRYHRPAGGEPAARYRRSVQRHLSRLLGADTSLLSTPTRMP